MAIDITSRFGFRRWGEDNDPQSREDFVHNLDQSEAKGATLDGEETLTNKTLSSPTLETPKITGLVEGQTCHVSVVGVFGTTNWSVPSSGYVEMPFGVVTEQRRPADTVDMWGAGNPTRLYARIRGIYLARFAFAYADQNGGGSIIVGRHHLRKNGAQLTNDGHVGYGQPGYGAGPDATYVLELNAGDYVTFAALNLSAPTWVVRGDTSRGSLTLLNTLS